MNVTSLLFFHFTPQKWNINYELNSVDKDNHTSFYLIYIFNSDKSRLPYYHLSANFLYFIVLFYIENLIQNLYEWLCVNWECDVII